MPLRCRERVFRHFTWVKLVLRSSTSYSLVFCARDWLPLVLLQRVSDLGEARRSVSLLLVSPLLSRLRPGWGCLRRSHAGAGSSPGVGELLPRLRTVMPGLGRERRLRLRAPRRPALLPRPKPSNPQPGWLRTADACLPPHSSAAPTVLPGSPLFPSILAASQGPPTADLAQAPARAKPLRQCSGGNPGGVHPRALSDAAGQAARPAPGDVEGDA